mgnify:CR=1 FL=1
MSNYTTSLRIQLLIQYIYNKKYSSKNEILNYLSEKDHSISSRTLDRYIGRIKADFGLGLEYSAKEKGYYIDDDKTIKADSFFKFLEIRQIADIFSKSLQESNNILEYVSFDDSKNFKGIDNLEQLLLAIKQKKEISFEHENYGRDFKKKYTITPLILKEYLNRWYIVGAFNNEGEIRTFGIDRIHNLNTGKLSKIKREKYLKNLNKFKHTIGLTYGDKEPEKVSLLIDELHVKYLRSLPLHDSQVIHPKNKNNKHQVDFYIYINYEFKTQILKIGTEAEVIFPKHLRSDIKNMLKASLDNYNS